MSTERLNSVMTLHIHKDRLDCIGDSAVVKDFAACNEDWKDIFGKGLNLPTSNDQHAFSFRELRPPELKHTPFISCLTRYFRLIKNPQNPHGSVGMEDHPHTHPIHIPMGIHMGIPIPTATLGISEVRVWSNENVFADRSLSVKS